MKRFLPILSIILLTALHSFGQASRSVSTKEPSEKIIKLYPNPAVSYITFELQKDFEKGYSILIFNFLSKKMYESQILIEKTSVSLSDFNRGVYIYHIRDLTGKIIESGKFQVSR